MNQDVIDAQGMLNSGAASTKELLDCLTWQSRHYDILRPHLELKYLNDPDSM